MSAYQHFRRYLREPWRVEWTSKSHTLFGIAMRLPFLRFIIRKVEEQQTDFKKYSEEMNNCKTCHTLTNYHRGVRLIIHLQMDHYLAEDRAISIVEDLWREVFILRPRREGLVPQQVNSVVPVQVNDVSIAAGFEN